MALTKVRRGGTDTGISDSSDATAITIDSSENVGIGTTSPTLANGKGVVIADATAARLKLCDTTTGEGASDGFQIGHSGGLAFIFNHEDEPIQFGTNNTERMRLDSSGTAMVGKTASNIGTAGFEAKSSGETLVTRNSDTPLQVNRLGDDGPLVGFYQATSVEGTISVSGSTVSYNGFSGQHESSGIATNTPIGTVVSTIDELDTYPTGTPKEGQTRTDHAKVEVSDTVGDSAVYGVVTRFDDNDKVFVASVGIGSVRVTGACAKGDLLESNGDGTAKVQSDDIVRSKTIGKVTIGNSSTDVKLVSCVLYCG